MTDQGPPDAYTLAQAFVTARYIERSSPLGVRYGLRWCRDEWFHYGAGHYRRLPESELKAEIAGYLNESDVPVSISRVNSILLCLHHLIGIDGRTEFETWLDGINGADVIVAANGNVSLSDTDRETGRPKLLPHTPSYFAMSALPYAYDPDAECPLWRTFLSDVVDDPEYVLLLQQWFGYLLRRDLKEQMFLLLVGPGGNGKSVFTAVMEAFVGLANVSHVSLARFDNPFALYGMLGKRLNITNETVHLIEEQAEATLKSLVAGDLMTFERKYRDPVEALPTSKIVITTNAAPRFSDRTWGLWRRLLLVNFQRVIPRERQIRNLADELKQELPGILNWAIDGLHSLNAKGFIIPAAHEQLLEQYRQDSDPARAFLIEHYQPGQEDECIPTSDVYGAYREWCEANGYKALGERTFGQAVHRTHPGVQRRRRGGRDNRQWVYAGLCPMGVLSVSQGDWYTDHPSEPENAENQEVSYVS